MKDELKETISSMNNIDLQLKDPNTNLASFEIGQDNQSEQLIDIMDESEKFKNLLICFNIEAATRQKFY